MSPWPGDGRRLALAALAGRGAPRPLTMLLTWGFDYSWRTAGLAPWQLAWGGSATWHRAHMALLERHQPDVLLYMGAGEGPAEPELVAEDAGHWLVREGNTGRRRGLLKGSLTPFDPVQGLGSADPTNRIAGAEEIERAIPPFPGYGHTYLQGLGELLGVVGERALVMPIHSPGYIRACYALSFERAMEAMLAEPAFFHRVAERYAAEDLPRFRELAAAGAEAVYVADSWASCDIISPRLFEEFALPYQRSMAKEAHRAGLRVVLWNLGDIAPILPLEAALPLDGFAFEQPRKGFGVTVAEVRAAFGPGRCLFGNVDSEGLLLRNDHAEIAEEVRAQARQAGAGAPFIHCTGSPLPSNVEPEAVDAMLRAARAASPS